MKGHVFLAQNSNTNYVDQAFVLAKSIKKHNQINNTCLITSDPVPDNFKHVFDYIVPIPGYDFAEHATWKIENRWKIYQITPFQENIVYDTDMILLGSNDHWWNFLSNHNVVVTSKVRDYRNNIINSNFYRESFVENNLPNAYMGVHYFKKSERAYEFYKWLELITKNYKCFYSEFLFKKKQKFCSMDLNAALAIRFMNAEHEFMFDVDTPSFIHMKPGVQKWKKVPKSWQDQIKWIYDSNLILSNVLQSGVFHYTEDNFLTKDFYD